MNNKLAVLGCIRFSGLINCGNGCGNGVNGKQKYSKQKTSTQDRSSRYDFPHNCVRSLQTQQALAHSQKGQTATEFQSILLAATSGDGKKRKKYSKFTHCESGVWMFEFNGDHLALTSPVATGKHAQTHNGTNSISLLFMRMLNMPWIQPPSNTNRYQVFCCSRIFFTNRINDIWSHLHTACCAPCKCVFRRLSVWFTPLTS